LKGRDYPNTIKGEVSKQNITKLLELCQLFAFRFRRVANIGLTNDLPENKRIEVKSVVHFMANKLLPTSSLQKNVTTLFVPDSPNYPSDFFLWDSDRQLLMGFQATVLNPFTDHPKRTNSETWERFCFGTSKPTPTEFYWVLPKCCVGAITESVGNDSIILFDDLTSDFPALGELVLQ
jgi:hypothetical protein